jgi:6-pyruvoyltetrahydropterin/6-carboxytetrahydropterin synthase
MTAVVADGSPAVVVAHNFETAHRLPHLPGKCVSLHGHSWWVQVTVAARRLDEAGTVVEFGTLKQRLRQWVDANLDHATMLAATDPLCAALRVNSCRLYLFGDPDPDGPYRHAQDLPWPTVENVAALLAAITGGILTDLDVPGDVHVAKVRVRETHVNEAIWTVR